MDRGITVYHNCCIGFWHWRGLYAGWLVSGIVGMTSAIIWILYNQTTNPLKLMALQQALTIVLMLSLSFGQPFGVPLTESLWLQIGALVVLAYA